MWAEERGKGHGALLEGWGEVRSRVPHAQLWIASDFLASTCVRCHMRTRLGVAGTSTDVGAYRPIS